MASPHHFCTRYCRLIILVCVCSLVLLVYHLPLPKHYCIVRQSTREKMLLLNESEIIPPLLKFESRFRWSPALKLNLCVIEKNLSTILTAIACFFYNPKRFREAGRNVNNETFPRRLCARRNEAYTFMAKIKNGLNESNEWLHLSVR
jgi:hypothetical protein